MSLQQRRLPMKSKPTQPNRLERLKPTAMSATPQDLKAPSIIERDIERALSRRGKALLEAPDLARQVGELEPLEAYFMVKELGLESAVLILLAASEEQLKTFVDLDCWNQDELSVEDQMRGLLLLRPSDRSRWWMPSTISMRKFNMSF